MRYPRGLKQVTGIAAGTYHSLAVRLDERLQPGVTTRSASATCLPVSTEWSLWQVAATAWRSRPMELWWPGAITYWASATSQRAWVVPLPSPPTASSLALIGTPPNRAPIAGTYQLSAPKDETQQLTVFQLHQACSDPDGQVFIIAGVSPQSAAGGHVMVQNAIIHYTPPSGFIGADSFNYTLVDTHQATAQGTVRVSVVLGATAPVIVCPPDQTLPCSGQLRNRRLQRGRSATTLIRIRK